MASVIPSKVSPDTQEKGGSMTINGSQVGAMIALVLSVVGIICGTVLVALGHDQVGSVLLAGAIGHGTGAGAALGSSNAPPS